MLILTRKPGQSIYIGDNIRLVFQGYNGNSAVIAIDAPKDVQILREELRGKDFEKKDRTGEEPTRKTFLKATSKTPVRTAMQSVVDTLQEEITRK